MQKTDYFIMRCCIATRTRKNLEPKAAARLWFVRCVPITSIWRREGMKNHQFAAIEEGQCDPFPQSCLIREGHVSPHPLPTPLEPPWCRGGGLGERRHGQIGLHNNHKDEHVEMMSLAMQCVFAAKGTVSPSLSFGKKVTAHPHVFSPRDSSAK